MAKVINNTRKKISTIPNSTFRLSVKEKKSTHQFPNPYCSTASRRDSSSDAVHGSGSDVSNILK